jgi:diguanylate cyclase (GGDEF)-like protein
VWNGPAGLTAPLRLEWRLILGRWLAILFVAAGLRVYLLSASELAAAYVVLCAGLLYSLLLLYLIEKQHPAVSDGVMPTVGDAVLCGAMFPVVGGFGTPFYAVLYLVVLSVGIRFGFKSGVLVAAFIGGIDAATSVATGGEITTSYMIRTGVIFGTVLITSYLHEETRQTQVTLAERLEHAEVLNTALQHQALHDSLTGLPNRKLLRERLADAIVEAAETGASGGLLLFDLDRFKEVNDSLGHPAGDGLLTEVAHRLMDQIGASGMVARLGGDEFAVLVTGSEFDEVLRIARRLNWALQQQVLVGEHSMHVRASLGVVMFPEHGDDADVLLSRADVAMYVSKQRGTELQVYDAARDDSARRLALVGELRDAIEGNQLVLHFQPKVSLRSDRVVGVEALVRWQHPERGLIGPDQFVPLAEQTGMIDRLTHRVIELALQQSREWRDRGLRLPIAINISARDLNDPGLADWMAHQILKFGVDPNDIEVEVTETMLISDPDQAARNLSALRTIGIKSAIDDFGTGYSSLGYLKRLPVSVVKIDRCFVQGMANDSGDLAIVAAAVDLSHRLGLHVLAEGVEDQNAIELLRELGCDEIQGYAVGRPQPAVDLERTVRRWPRAVRTPLHIVA